MRHPLIKLVYLSSLLRMLNDHRTIDTVFFSSLSRSCQRISFDDPLNWSWSTSYSQPLLSSSSILLSPLQNFLNQHYTVSSLAVLGSNALLMFKSSPLLYHPFGTQIRKVLKIAFFFKKKYFIFNWKITNLQYCDGFCHTRHTFSALMLYRSLNIIYPVVTILTVIV